MTDQAPTTENPSNAVSTTDESPSLWQRLLYMLAFTLIWSISRFVIGAIVVIQFFVVLLTKEANDSLKSLGNQLATYTMEIIRFLTFNTEEKPFPFGRDWPEDSDKHAGL